MKRIINREGGFTLIELLVVILIIGILIAVAAPSFLGQVGKAHDSKTKQNLALAYKSAKASSIDRSIQGNWTDTADADGLTGGAGYPDSRPDRIANTGGPGAPAVEPDPNEPLAAEFDEFDLVRDILASEPQMATDADGADVLANGNVLVSDENPDADALANLPTLQAFAPEIMFLAVTCNAGDCDNGQVLHLYAGSKSGKIWKIEVPANGPIGTFEEFYTP